MIDFLNDVYTIANSFFSTPILTETINGQSYRLTIGGIVVSGLILSVIIRLFLPRVE